LVFRPDPANNNELERGVIIVKEGDDFATSVVSIVAAAAVGRSGKKEEKNIEKRGDTILTSALTL
jgi:hypothetical protein